MVQKAPPQAEAVQYLVVRLKKMIWGMPRACLSGHTVSLILATIVLFKSHDFSQILVKHWEQVTWSSKLSGDRRKRTCGSSLSTGACVSLCVSQAPISVGSTGLRTKGLICRITPSTTSPVLCPYVNPHGLLVAAPRLAHRSKTSGRGGTLSILNCSVLSKFREEGRKVLIPKLQVKPPRLLG